MNLLKTSTLAGHPSRFTVTQECGLHFLTLVDITARSPLSRGWVDLKDQCPLRLAICRGGPLLMEGEGWGDVA